MSHLMPWRPLHVTSDALEAAACHICYGGALSQARAALLRTIPAQLRERWEKKGAKWGDSKNGIWPQGRTAQRNAGEEAAPEVAWQGRAEVAWQGRAMQGAGVRVVSEYQVREHRKDGSASLAASSVALAGAGCPLLSAPL